MNKMLIRDARRSIETAHNEHNEGMHVGLPEARLPADKLDQIIKRWELAIEQRDRMAEALRDCKRMEQIDMNVSCSGVIDDALASIEQKGE